MKTIEDVAFEYSETVEKPDVINDFKHGIEFAQRWIPIEDEKPPEQGHYLVKCKNSFPKNCEVVVAEFYEDNETFYSESTDFPINDATHWRLIDLK